jgi:hypothetical protein
MKLLDGRTVTDTVKVSLTAADVTAIADDAVLATIAVPANTLITKIFAISDDLDTNASPTLEIDLGHTGFTDTDGTTVAAAPTVVASSDITETGGQLISDGLFLVGVGGTSVQVRAEGTAATAAAGDIRVGYIGVAVPAGS